MTDSCAVDGCSLNDGGQCKEHEQEVKRRRAIEKLVLEIQKTVSTFDSNANRMNGITKRLTKMFYITLGSTSLIIGGLVLCFYILQHQDTKMEDRLALTKHEKEVAVQQSIDRDHLIVSDIKADREVQLQLIKIVEGIQIRYEITTENHKMLTDKIEYLESKIDG